MKSGLVAVGLAFDHIRRTTLQHHPLRGAQTVTFFTILLAALKKQFPTTYALTAFISCGSSCRLELPQICTTTCILPNPLAYGSRHLHKCATRYSCGVVAHSISPWIHRIRPRGCRRGVSWPLQSAGLQVVERGRQQILVSGIVSVVLADMNMFKSSPVSCFVANGRATLLVNLDPTSIFDDVDISSRPAKIPPNGLKNSFLQYIVVLQELAGSACVVIARPSSHVGSSAGFGYSR